MSSDEKKSILIIDDDITIRKLIGFHLKHNNYEIHEANGPEKAFDILDSEKIDLVLCDVTMGDMDGYTFCSKVRENENFRALPFVFVTAKNSMEDKSRALDAGGDDIITKPFDINELLLKVQALLRRTEIYKAYGTKKNLEKSFSEHTAAEAPSTILLVDDDLSLARLFQYNLNKSGFDCKIASGAQEGLKLASEIIPDIIISDIMMPNVDGFMFRKMLLAEPKLKSIPFVFLTSKSDEEDILDGYDLGITEYVLKTAGPRVVVAKVSAIIKSLGKERQKVVTELHQAADSLRAKVVPDNNPVFAGFKIAHWHQPFQGIPGGDFIDYFQLDDDNFAVVLGDVMGKKWGAWYFAFAYAGYVRSAMRIVLENAKEFSPGEIMQQVNKSVYRDAKISEVFATLSVVILNKNDKTLKYTGAGDLPLIYKDSVSGDVKRIQSKGMLLGFSADGNYTDQEIKLASGDIIFLTTDGIIESRNSEGIQFGTGKFNEIVQLMLPEDSPNDVLKKEFTEFTSGKFEDDISLITIKVL